VKASARTRARSLPSTQYARNFVDSDYFPHSSASNFDVATSLLAFPLSSLYCTPLDHGSYKSMATLLYSTIFSVVPLILPSISLVSSNCYCIRDNDIFDCSTTETVCGIASSVDSGAQLCCVAGDQCGIDSVCHLSKQIAITSGYYLGGCTNPTYNDPVCQKHCS
jgi:hypothetical protein